MQVMLTIAPHLVHGPSSLQADSWGLESAVALPGGWGSDSDFDPLLHAIVLKLKTYFYIRETHVKVA